MSSAARTPAVVLSQAPADRFRLTETIPFALVHIACFAAIWTGISLVDVALAIALYAVRMFAITAGYHRYFSHRTFETGRVFRFVLAFLAQTSAQRGVLWWAGNHRHHHRYSDTDEDVHSPARRGFWYSHFGWFFTEKYARTDPSTVPDLAKYPELRWLDRHPYLPAVAMGFLAWLVAGWSGLVVGFCWSTVAVWHATFSINSLAHVLGRRRYLTGDDSRNNWWLALLTFGEGWHNNHHHYQGAARQGFRWYEIDLSYYALKALAALRVVWDLREPPASVVRNEARLGRAVVERAAAQLAAGFPIDSAAADLRARMAATRASMEASIDDWHAELAALIERWQQRFDGRIDAARQAFDALIRDAALPAMPTAADLRARAAAIFVGTPSMNEIVERARQRLVEKLFEELVAPQLRPIPIRARR